MNRIAEAIRYFFNADTLNPHGVCLLWRPELLWTHIVSDAAIGVAYFSIPLALGVFAYHRRDVRFGWVIWLFVAFIMLCGVTHFFAIWTLWNADYGIEALIKAVTGVASVLTAVALWPLLPRVIALPSPAQLEARVAERDQALAELHAAMADMMQMREHEARQKLLLDELNHRVKNTLISVQSIAAQTIRGSGSMAEFQDTFGQRLQALSRTHDLLVESSWEHALLHQLIARNLEPYGKPFTVDGPDLRLHPNFAVTLGMALHELATNALKHGAWSGAGRVRIELGVEAETVRIAWREEGGPAVRAPGREGFGSRLLQRGVASQLGGAVELDYRPEGLVCTIRAPLSDQLSAVAAA
jgi:two-component sensor histidine kinase